MLNRVCHRVSPSALYLSPRDSTGRGKGKDLIQSKNRCHPVTPGDAVTARPSTPEPSRPDPGSPAPAPAAPQLRPYQLAAVTAVREWYRARDLTSPPTATCQGGAR